jgi:hypothetical protein
VTKHKRRNDHVVCVADHRHKVRDNIDGRHQVREQQPYRDASSERNGSIGREALHKAPAVREEAKRVLEVGVLRACCQGYPYEQEPNDNESGKHERKQSPRHGCSLRRV